MDHAHTVIFFWMILLPLFCYPILPLSQSQLLPITDEPIGNTIADQMHTTYIVHVEQPESLEFLAAGDLRRWHESFLPNTTLDSGETRLIYSYREVISGFAADLTAEEAIEMQSKDGVLNVRPDESYQLETTYTPDLLGLRDSFGGAWWAGTDRGEGIVIGVLDSGITPTHPSFGDDGMPPPPVTWKGICTNTSGVTCNNKIIGAKAFNGKTKSTAIDTSGHGTHVAGIAAGNIVDHANVLGTGNGTASGMAPRAHLAIYKVCFKGCSYSDILKAVDEAIDDGVDVLSMSFGLTANRKYYEDGAQHGSLTALSHGIMAVSTAGNKGPDENTLSHDAPWVLTVGASSTDRRIGAIVKLGNGRELAGESAFQPSSFNSSLMLPLIFPGDISGTNATYCYNGSLASIDVRKKIVLCYSGGSTDIEKGEVVFAAGGAAMIIANGWTRGSTTNSVAHILPVARLSFRDGREVENYYYSLKKSTSNNATATIMFNGTTFGHRPSPAVTSFSSRGPAPMNGGILKPDVLAPGLNILSAWHREVGPNPTGLATSTFNYNSGTSMAAPHASGVVALIMKKHPGWTPAMIQSAIITSAQDRDMDGRPIVDQRYSVAASIFATGSGQINPKAALDPGLVYDINPSDYVGYLCGLGYNNTELKILYKRTINCSAVNHIEASSLNYPSIQVTLPRSGGSVTVKRTAKNVGAMMVDYKAKITEPKGVTVNLSTYDLKFSRRLQEKSFNVTLTISPSGPGMNPHSHGKIEWVSGSLTVKSTIAVRFS
ncbi:subtilisin-like protease 4 [Typha angustifolia]|uniref:subtilisin-like protease 4 n=1 Tax=Typha angustifolia TaxID=59011 RepID=UPI003C2F0A52